MYFVIIGVIYLISVIIIFGILNAEGRAKYYGHYVVGEHLYEPGIALLFSCMFGAFGPIGVITIVLITNFCKHGFKFNIK